MRIAESNQLSRELKKLILLFIARPVEPTNLIVLAISVVVAVLWPSPLVSATEHWHALRKKKCGQKIPPLSLAQRVDLRILSWALRAAIPREIIIIAVFVAVVVRLVVLVVVADQVVQRETIVRGDKIDAGVRASPIMLV